MGWTPSSSSHLLQFVPGLKQKKVKTSIDSVDLNCEYYLDSKILKKKKTTKYFHSGKADTQQSGNAELRSFKQHQFGLICVCIFCWERCETSFNRIPPTEENKGWCLICVELISVCSVKWEKANYQKKILKVNSPQFFQSTICESFLLRMSAWCFSRSDLLIIHRSNVILDCFMSPSQSLSSLTDC